VEVILYLAQFLIYDLTLKNDLTSDYKDDGQNILLDANENAYGPGLALGLNGSLAKSYSNGTEALNPYIDLSGLNRYPDP